ncbi:MAG TPA: 2-oxo-3-hexenedioate decarboxylase [Burkholderiaceae bacterium]|nr:2-oxo-3-hexenedioate decarboxylase [Burkholderiaceae bacterium]
MRTTLGEADLRLLTDRIEAAQRSARAIRKLTDDFPGMTLGDGYAVQLALLQRWLDEGSRQVGWKAGLTSKAKMDQMGVRVPSIGFLLADMEQAEDSVVSTEELVHPRVECELAFVTKAPLAGRDCSRDEVLAATDHVVPALEIIDSRFAGFKFDLQSVAADNGSAARFVRGARALRPEALALDTLDVLLEKNGATVAAGNSAAVMGHTADAVALLVRVLAELGRELPAGSFVMSGAITEAIAIEPGDRVCARFQQLGSVSVRFG